MAMAEPAPAQSDSEGKPLLDPKWHRPLSINRRTAPHFALMQNSMQCSRSCGMRATSGANPTAPKQQVYVPPRNNSRPCQRGGVVASAPYFLLAVGLRGVVPGRGRPGNVGRVFPARRLTQRELSI